MCFDSADPNGEVIDRWRPKLFQFASRGHQKVSSAPCDHPSQVYLPTTSTAASITFLFPLTASPMASYFACRACRRALQQNASSFTQVKFRQTNAQLPTNPLPNVRDRRPAVTVRHPPFEPPFQSHPAPHSSNRSNRSTPKRPRRPPPSRTTTLSLRSRNSARRPAMPTQARVPVRHRTQL